MPVARIARDSFRPHQIDLRVAPQSSQEIASSNRLISWVVLVGIFLPAIPFEVAGLNWTPGRLVTMLFLGLALWVVLTRRRHYLSDFLVFLVSVWCIGSVVINGGFRPYVLVESLELLSGYMIGRAFFDTRSKLEQFVHVLKIVAIVLIMLAAVDTFSGRRFTAETAARLFGAPFDIEETQFRYGLVRATSTFPVAELYGTFCAAAAGIFLYAERTATGKLLYGSLCIFGCFLSVSSGPILALLIVLGTYFYDRLMRRFPMRWKALRNSAIGLLLIIFLGDTLVLGNDAVHPLLWIVRNFTFDPWTGYFRVEEWRHAMVVIENSPIIGIGFNPISDKSDIFLHSLDSLYLVITWRFGIPPAILLILAIIATITGLGPSSENSGDSYMLDLRTGFVLVVVSIALIALTVHFWDSTWIFWSICLGICASFKGPAHPSPHEGLAKPPQSRKSFRARRHLHIRDSSFDFEKRGM
jgi:hypothetical protein